MLKALTRKYPSSWKHVWDELSIMTINTSVFVPTEKYSKLPRRSHSSIIGIEKKDILHIKFKFVHNPSSIALSVDLHCDSLHPSNQPPASENINCTNQGNSKHGALHLA